MSEVLEFACRNDFRNWLRENCLSDAGVWLLFGKPGGPQTVKADEALEEALCFGWIEKQGIMTDYGRKKIEEAKKNGQWNAPKAPAITEEEIASVAALLETHEPAFTNFQAMPPSVKKTYTRAYLDAKTEAGREKRLAWMIERLNKNLKPM